MGDVISRPKVVSGWNNTNARLLSSLLVLFLPVSCIMRSSNMHLYEFSIILYNTDNIVIFRSIIVTLFAMVLVGVAFAIVSTSNVNTSLIVSGESNRCIILDSNDIVVVTSVIGSICSTTISITFVEDEIKVVNNLCILPSDKCLLHCCWRDASLSHNNVTRRASASSDTLTNVDETIL